MSTNTTLTTLEPVSGLALVTDGSANNKNRTGGWAWIALDADDGLVKGSGYQANTTSNQMELVAPTNGLDYLHHNYGPCEVLVYSDSEYVVLGANDKSRARISNKRHWKRLDAAIKQHTTVEFIHIKGHSGYIYNEMADELAVKARREGAK